jgi:plastocyanin
MVLFVLWLLTWVSPAYADADVDMVEPSETDMMSWAFDPPEVTIEAGQMVTWTNSGSQPHTATAVSGTFDTGEIAPGESKTMALAAAGTYEYICTPHPWMKGTLQVTAAGAEPAAQQTTAPVTLPTLPPATKPAALPTIAAAAPAAQAAPTPTPFRLVTTSPATTPTPRAGSLSMELALPLLAGGAGAAAAGLYLLRRRR